MMKKITVAAFVIGAAVVGTAATADSWMNWFGGKTQTTAKPAAAATAPGAPAMAMVGNALDIQANDRVIGAMTAPVTMIEYASMTCSHCADFAKTVMPSVKKDYVATGKVKYVPSEA